MIITVVVKRSIQEEGPEKKIQTVVELSFLALVLRDQQMFPRAFSPCSLLPL